MTKSKSTLAKQAITEPSKNESWGFKTFSEKINGRAAMVGFVLLLLFELITKTKIF